ncbi:5-carboxymethyl-2-hydroxymuconate Delta-isomerase [Amorphus sp. 3PC139-8]|uniref:5-carboxymethyl-2-hydroxymuconate Delta-isomerase n=1 Tax=Amorphus sp. 3PC139-8 TaxID=2735676 RepID=UPI00345D8708
MPHISFEYSANLDGDLDMPGFMEALRTAAVETGVFDPAGIRVRAVRCADYLIADGHPDNAFIDMSVRLRGGRPIEARKAATQAIFNAAETFLSELFVRRPLALSLEMRDIDPELSPKCGSIREHMKQRGVA